MVLRAIEAPRTLDRGLSITPLAPVAREFLRRMVRKNSNKFLLTYT